MARRQPTRLRAVIWAAIFLGVLLAAVAGGTWALPGRAAGGQTIPFPTATPTPTATGLAPPTPTWTPRPTWTRVPTLPAESPAPTATPVDVPSATLPLVPTPTAIVVPATATAIMATVTLAAPPTAPAVSPTPSTPAPFLPSPSTPPSALPLAFDVVVLPPVAGPRDAVQFVVQVASVGYDALDGVQVVAAMPRELSVRAVDCPRCAVEVSSDAVTVRLGRLLPGEQVIAPVAALVAADAWPGRTLQTEWTITAAGLPAQTVRVGVVLPWAGLPRTGQARLATPTQPCPAFALPSHLWSFPQSLLSVHFPREVGGDNETIGCR